MALVLGSKTLTETHLPMRRGLRRETATLPGSFRPEQMDSYEIGFKTSYLDGGISTSMFMYDYTDAQVIKGYYRRRFQDDAIVDAFVRVLNVGQTDGMGEASTTVAVNEYTTLYLSLGYSIPATGLEDFGSPDSPAAKALAVKEAASSGLKLTGAGKPDCVSRCSSKRWHHRIELRSVLRKRAWRQLGRLS